MYLSIGEAAAALGVCTKTLRRWEARQQLTPSFRTVGAHRRYSHADICRLKGVAVVEDGADGGEPTAMEEPKPTMTYARVSSHDQARDLTRQTQTLREHCILTKGLPENQVLSVEDIGSGINFKKKGLRSLIKSVLSREVSEVVVAYPDRLTRFGFDLIHMICNLQDVRLTVLEEKPTRANDQLAHDLIEIITVFSARLYGRRSADHRRKKTVLLTDGISDGGGVLYQGLGSPTSKDCVPKEAFKHTSRVSR